LILVEVEGEEEEEEEEEEEKEEGVSLPKKNHIKKGKKAPVAAP
jgi:hypothetical protein